MTFYIHHIALSVGNLQRSIQFYEKFGFKEVKRFTKQEPKCKAIFMQLGEIQLELFDLENDRELPGYRHSIPTDLKAHGTKHFALGVEDIDTTIKELNDIGLNIPESRIDDSGYKVTFITDPDGILVELIESFPK